jgi:2-polyprenyl-6-methoxyphenol hydroxylase-like FAD-dependent oxidoreductase
VLLTGLDDVVHFNRRFTHYEVLDGRVVAYFANGDAATGDVLVGADGGGSRVRRQYLPQADRIETGVSGLQGKVWLTDEIRGLVLQRLVDGPIMVPGPGGYGMFLALHEFQPIPPHVSRLVGPQVADQRDYVMWGLLARRTRLPADLLSLDSAGLRNLAANAIRDWHPGLRRLVDASDLDTMLLTPVRSAARVDPWPPSPITLLGDAIHSMPPTGGIGANTALRDAALLSRQLASAAQGRVHPVDAIAAYES